MITNQNAHDDITEQFRYFKANKSARFTRLLFSDDLIEHYFEQNEQIPPTTVLDRLGTLILQDELADRDIYKITHNERPLLSERQMERRLKREYSAEAIEFNHSRVIGRKKTFFDDDNGTPQGRNSYVHAPL